MHAILQTRELILANEEEIPNLDIPPGLTLIHCNPLLDAATLAMTLGGRLASKSGEILVRSGHKRASSKKIIQQSVALAGVPEVDSLEPRVPIRSLVREQVVWTSRWWQQVPKKLSQIERFQRAAELMDFQLSDESAKTTTVAALNPLEAFKLRIVLALVARPEATLLVVNDIDSVRNVHLRRELLQHLRSLSDRTAVAVLSTNALDREICHSYIDLDGHAPELPPATPQPAIGARAEQQVDEGRELRRQARPSFQKPLLDYRTTRPPRARGTGEFQKPKPQIVPPPRQHTPPPFPPNTDGPRA
ncbi:hypothetical protein [Corynebacterium gerontici]|nr:hypothetical protein [Corynebacterium gerontici]